ncbi:hypothetical protein KCQ_13790 [Pectobacterium atrosepticum ICMP 1526]|nr:hypothetical protein KCQ_13790 [Pectobacterium atrosepticum ICMP 1526]
MEFKDIDLKKDNIMYHSFTYLIGSDEKVYWCGIIYLKSLIHKKTPKRLLKKTISMV